MLYLIAFAIKFNTTCFMRLLSTSTIISSLENFSCSRIIPFLNASAWQVEITSSTIGIRSVASISIFKFPDSTADKSSISFISFKRCFPDEVTWSNLSFWWIGNGFIESLLIRSVKPKIAFMGVLNSWLIWVKNSVLAWLAFSAAFFARMILFSAIFRLVMLWPYILK